MNYILSVRQSAPNHELVGLSNSLHRRFLIAIGRPLFLQEYVSLPRSIRRWQVMSRNNNKLNQLGLKTWKQFFVSIALEFELYKLFGLAVRSVNTAEDIFGDNIFLLQNATT